MEIHCLMKKRRLGTEVGRNRQASKVPFLV
jgi:hypothetical protein